RCLEVARVAGERDDADPPVLDEFGPLQWQWVSVPRHATAGLLHTAQSKCGIVDPSTDAGQRADISPIVRGEFRPAEVLNLGSQRICRVGTECQQPSVAEVANEKEVALD